MRGVKNLRESVAMDDLPVSPPKKKQNRFEVLTDFAADLHHNESEISAGSSGEDTPRSDGRSAASSSESGPQTHGPAPPAWFCAFDKRFAAFESRFALFESNQNAQLESIKAECRECREEHDALRLDVQNVQDQVSKLTSLLSQAELKIDDLENRSRRNNLVLYGVPEGFEGNGSDCVGLVKNLLQQAGVAPQDVIQRAHRSGRIQDASKDSSNTQNLTSSQERRPRPIHTAFSSFVDKERSRKALVALFKQKKFGPKSTLKFYVSDDYSRKVQKMRKEKLPELRRLREEGKKAYMIYPATIRIVK